MNEMYKEILSVFDKLQLHYIMTNFLCVYPDISKILF